MPTDEILAPQRDPKRFPFTQVPVRVLAPNLVTLLALCSGLTSFKLAFEGRIELALTCIIAAAILDGIDGRLARMLKGTSKFGAELDSLTDFVNFGCAPAIVLYVWILNGLGNVGWIVALAFAICGALRLARFNVQLDDPNKPAWANNFFTGIPAPAGALCALLPVYAVLVGLPKASLPAGAVLVYTALIAGLMVSKVPTFSGKKLGLSVGREKVIFLLLGLAIFVALLVTYTWEVMLVCTLIYLAMLPVGLNAWRKLAAADRAQAQSTTPAGGRITARMVR
jgi:CDP-diacylglycerol--serine O-phosphatidyltransferase